MSQKALLILILGITIATSALAGESPTATHISVINRFMESYINSDYKVLKEILSEDAVYTSNRDVRVIKHSAAEVIKQMKNTAGVKQGDCNVSSTIISETDALVIARVDVNYDLFNGKQQNFVVIERSKEGDWKITQVYKIYVSNESSAKKLV